MAYDLFDATNGSKSLVSRFQTYDQARAHAVEIFGDLIAEETDIEALYHAVDIFTARGEILAIEQVERSFYAA